MEEFEKQGYEEFTIKADFSENMNIGDVTGETITSQTVTAVDNADTVSDAIVLVQASITAGAEDVSVLCRAGTEALEPYKLTFKCETSLNHKWELDVLMKIREI